MQGLQQLFSKTPEAVLQHQLVAPSLAGVGKARNLQLPFIEPPTLLLAGAERAHRAAAHPYSVLFLKDLLFSRPHHQGSAFLWGPSGGRLFQSIV